MDGRNVKLVFVDRVKKFEQGITESALFRDWLAKLGPQWQGDIVVIDADIWGGAVHMIYVSVRAKGDPWAIRGILRTETVDVLTMVTDGVQKYVVFTEQDRPIVGCRVVSNVAGGIERESPVAAARREISEELGLDLDFEIVPLVDKPVLASPGMIDERVHLMRATLLVPSGELTSLVTSLRGKKTGVAEEGEDIMLHVVLAKEVREFILAQPQVDAKTLLSVSLAGG